ncbi:amidohydrolase family protein [Microbacterium album]|uniref:Amidohydrolase n=1 Tax=Microbacterium album TaxID=2053191 RepID=A0A917MMA1_9MICO|nr:amidohydrolase family protein [Microbacterium album]GGH47226.1 amidohydrolase [Microbacterium album]
MPIVDVHAHLAVFEAEALLADHPGLQRQQAVDLATMGAASNEYNQRAFSDLFPRLTDVEVRLAQMDASSVDVQTVSAMPTQRHWLEERLAVRYHRALNDGVAQHCAAAPERLRMIASVPYQHPAAAADELTRAVEQLGAIGVQILTHAGPDFELDDRRLDSLWERAVELDVPVLIHPWGCTLGARLDIGYLFNHVGNPTETSLALSRLIFGGVFDRIPALRVWAAHGGGWLPSYSGRADHAWKQRADARTCASKPSDYLRDRVWVDGLVYTPHALRFLVESVGAAHVTVGTDYPFDMGITDPLERIAAAGLSVDDFHATTEHSARLLFGNRLTANGARR